MKYSLVICGALFLCNVVSAFTLDEAVKRAYENSIEIDIAVSGQKKSEEGLSQAERGWFPVLSVELGTHTTFTSTKSSVPPSGAPHQQSRTNSGIIKMSQNLFNGGATLASIKGAESVKERALYNTESSRMFFLVAAVQTYVELVAARLLKNAAESNAKVYETELHAARSRFDVGEDTIASVEAIRAEYEGAKAHLIERKMQVKNAESQYIRIIGAMPPENLETPKEPVDLPHTEEELVRITLTHNFDIKTADAVVTAAEAGADDALSSLMPSVDFNASYGRQGTDAIGALGAGSHTTQRQNTGVLGLTLSIPLDVRGSIQAGVRAKKYDAATAKLQAVQKRRSTIQDILKVWYTYQEQVAKIPQFEAQHKSTDLAFKNVQAEYRLGSKTYLDVITAGQKRLDATNKLIVAAATKVVSSFELLAKMGVLSSSRFGITDPAYNPTTVGSVWGASNDTFEVLNQSKDVIVDQYREL